MYELTNIKELAQYIELYKTGKITEYSLEKELGSAAQTLIRTSVPVSVKLVDNEKSATSSTFIITSIPQVGQSSNLTIIIDKKAVKNLLSPEEVVKVLITEVSNSQDVLKEYSRFIITKSGSDISVSDVLMTLLSIYKISLSTLYEKHEKLMNRLTESKSVPSLELINSETKILADGIERLDIIMERLVVSDALPYRFIEVAKEVAQKMREDYLKDESFTARTSNDRPEYNSFFNRLQSLGDKSYKTPSKTIAHDYKPDTNL
jgi:hypothetical protein